MTATLSLQASLPALISYWPKCVQICSGIGRGGADAPHFVGSAYHLV